MVILTFEEEGSMTAPLFAFVKSYSFFIAFTGFSWRDEAYHFFLAAKEEDAITLMILGVERESS
jgi:hypothetical protein